MAAPFSLKRGATVILNFSNGMNTSHIFSKSCLNTLKSHGIRQFNFRASMPKSKLKTALTVGAGAGGFLLLQKLLNRHTKAFALDESKHLERLSHKPSRQILVDTDTSGLKLTIYQYQTCPFCCKTRAYLDYHGLSYDVVEVNSVTKKQLKWSEYPKVPVVVVEGSQGRQPVILRDSTNIISVLESYLEDKTTSIEKYLSYYPCMEEKDGKKIKYEFPNKYFIMYQDRTDTGTTQAQKKEERKWREWVDSNLVHMLSPNAYRTPSEAYKSFHWFSEVGEWDQNFGFLQTQMVIYVGGSVMWVLGKVLRRKYKLKEDVRQSLYDSCNEWVAAVGRDRPFMGGSQPNLADLAVYGVLNSIEGCDAFQDCLDNSRIGPWYRRTHKTVTSHMGANPHHAKTLSSKHHKEHKDIEQSLSKA